MKCEPSPSLYKYEAGTDCRSGSLNLSLALNVFSKTALVRRLRILRRTRVWPPRAVGVFTSASRQQKGVFSSSNNVLRLTLIASISAAMKSFKQGGTESHMQSRSQFPTSIGVNCSSDEKALAVVQWF